MRTSIFLFCCCGFGGSGLQNEIKVPVLVKGVHDEPKGNHDLSLFLYIHDIGGKLREQVEKGGTDKRRIHGRSQAVLDGVQALVEGQKGTTASGNRSTEDGSEDRKGEFTGRNGVCRGKGKLGYDESTERLVQNRNARLSRNITEESKV